MSASKKPTNLRASMLSSIISDSNRCVSVPPMVASMGVKGVKFVELMAPPTIENPVALVRLKVPDAIGYSSRWSSGGGVMVRLKPQARSLAKR